MSDFNIGDKGRVWCNKLDIITGFNLDGKTSSGTLIGSEAWLEIITIHYIKTNYLIIAPRDLGWRATDMSEDYQKSFGLDLNKRYFWVGKDSMFPLKPKCKQCKQCKVV